MGLGVLADGLSTCDGCSVPLKVTTCLSFIPEVVCVHFDVNTDINVLFFQMDSIENKLSA